LEDFVKNGFDTLSTIAALEEKDFETLGIDLPGHRKKLLMAAELLRNPDGVKLDVQKKEKEEQEKREREELEQTRRM